MKVFVYGTLKRGWHNHRLLRGANFLGSAMTVNPFVLLDAGFPVMTPLGCGGTRVLGELYEFEDAVTLKNLDALEGEGHMYDRVLIYVLDEAGEPHEVWTYVGCAGMFTDNALATQWLDGDTFNFRGRTPILAEAKRGYQHGEQCD